MHHLIPVRARRQIIYPSNVDEALGVNAPSNAILRRGDNDNAAAPTPHALVHINRKLVLEPKTVVNARVVVVGASTVSLAFLETFAFCPYLRFNNLVLISPHGLPGEFYHTWRLP